MRGATVMASVPYEFECDKNFGFLPGPNERKSVGYITSLAGFNAAGPFKPDLQVFVPWNGTGTRPSYPGLKFTQPPSASLLGKATVVGVIEKFSWPGGAGNPITIDLWVSQENATQLKAIQQSKLTTKVTALEWWICAYDQEAKVWYEQAYPKNVPAITGTITGKDNPELDVDLLGAPVMMDGIDLNVYRVTMSVTPAANQQYSLHFANSPKSAVVKSWGLVVGTPAKADLPADPI
jgi:hypothetical protein